MPTEPNRAERLYRFLDAAQKTSGSTTNKRFGELLAVSGDSTEELMHGLMAYHTLVTQLGLEIEHIQGKGEGMHTIFLEIEPRVRRALTPDGWWSSWDSQKQHITDPVLMALKSLSAFLSKHHTNEQVTESTLTAIGDQLNALERAVAECSMDPQTKRLILNEIEIIRRALLDYRILGLQVLEDAFHTAVGTVVAKKEHFEQLKSTAVLEYYIKMLTMLDLAISTANHAKQLTEPAVKYLAAKFGVHL